MYVIRSDQPRLHQFMIALHDNFEPIHVQLLHCFPLPTLDTAIFHLVCAKTRSQTMRSQPSHTMLVAPSSGSSSFQLEHSYKSGTPWLSPKYRDNNYCHYCRRRGHTLDKCWQKRRCNAPIAAVAHTKSGSSPAAPSSIAPFGQSSGSSVTLFTANLKPIVNQVLLSRSGNASSSVLLVLPNTFSSWPFDSTCCIHMTPYPTSLTTYAPRPHSSLIHTTDGSTMTIKNIGTIKTPSFFVLEVFDVLELSFNPLCLLANCVNLDIDLFLTSLVCMCRILIQARPDHWYWA